MAGVPSERSENRPELCHTCRRTGAIARGVSHVCRTDPIKNGALSGGRGTCALRGPTMDGGRSQRGDRSVEQHSGGTTSRGGVDGGGPTQRCGTRGGSSKDGHLRRSNTMVSDDWAGRPNTFLSTGGEIPLGFLGHLLVRAKSHQNLPWPRGEAHDCFLQAIPQQGLCW
jgi:hypothetical protein